MTTNFQRAVLEQPPEPFRKTLDLLRQEYEQDDDGVALLNAMYLVWMERLPLPFWLAAALEGCIAAKFDSASHRQSVATERIDMERWEKVLELRKRGVKWREIWNMAAHELAPTGGGPDAIKKSYQRVNKRYQQFNGRMKRL